jgi:hypothetical protein
LNHPDRTLASSRRAYRQRREFIRAVKDVPCADCGGKFPDYCMDFHHRDRTTKSFTIGHFILGSLAGLKAEIAKCDVVCANCHRIRTHATKFRVRPGQVITDLPLFAMEAIA